MGMRVASLASGSSGNSYYIEGDSGALLVDAGLSAKAILHNLALIASMLTAGLDRDAIDTGFSNRTSCAEQIAHFRICAKQHKVTFFRRVLDRGLQ